MANAKVRLGKFVLDKEGVLHGRISGLGIGSTDILSEEVTSLEGKAYLKLVADPLGDAYDVGAAFPKEKDGMKYYSVNLESPLLPAPINAALFPDRGVANSFNLIWNRPEPSKPAIEAEAESTPLKADADKKAPPRRRFGAGVAP